MFFVFSPDDFTKNAKAAVSGEANFSKFAEKFFSRASLATLANRVLLCKTRYTASKNARKKVGAVAERELDAVFRA